jgi:tetratricopeptide (TPR) repeat protein
VADLSEAIAPVDAGLRLLGRLELGPRASAQPLTIDRPTQLLVYLAVSGQWVSRNALAQLLFGAAEPLRARSNLRKIIFLVRRLPWAADLEIADDQLRWLVDTDVKRLLGWRRADVHTLLREFPEPALDPRLDHEASDEYLRWLDLVRDRCLGAWRLLTLTACRLQPSAEALQLCDTLLSVDPEDHEALAVQALVRASLRAETGAAPAGPARPAQPAAWAHRLAGADAAERQSEVDALVARVLLGTERLLTLAGPPGVGKSFVAELLVEDLRLGNLKCHWLDLGDLADTQGADQRLRSILRLRPAETLAGALQRSRGRDGSLLVLNDCERLLSTPQQAAPFRELVAQLLATPDLRVVAASQRWLELPGEAVVPVTCLNVQPPTGESGAEAGAEAALSPAVRFLMRKALEQGNDLLRADSGRLVQLATALRGHPLALLLAVRWSNLIGTEQLIEDLERHLPRDAGPPGSQEAAGLAFTLERAWNMLPQAQAEALMALAVLRGEFTLELGLVVTGQPLEVMRQLVTASLLQTRRADALQMFFIHPVVRAHALRAGERAALPVAPLLARIRQFCLERIVRAADRSRTAAADWGRRLEPDLEQCIHAWNSAVETGDAGFLGAAADSLLSYLQVSGRSHLAVSLLESATRSQRLQGRAGLLVRASLWRHYGYMVAFTAGTETVSTAARTSLQLAEAAGADEAIVESLILLIKTQIYTHQTAAARAQAKRALELARRIGSESRLVEIHYTLAAMELEDGQFQAAADGLAQSIEYYRRVDDARRELAAAQMLAHAFVGLGRFDDGLALLDQAIAKARQLSMPRLSVHMSRVRASALFQAGHYAAAEDEGRRLMDQRQELGRLHWSSHLGIMLMTRLLGPAAAFDAALYREKLDLALEAQSTVDERQDVVIVSAVRAATLGDAQLAAVLFRTLQVHCTGFGRALVDRLAERLQSRGLLLSPDRSVALPSTDAAFARHLDTFRRYAAP